MSSKDSKTEYHFLIEQLHYHNYRYHVLNDPVISDYEFDQKLNRLKAIEEAHPDWTMPDSPSQRAGAEPLSQFNKVTHPVPILSLGNAFDEQDIRDWHARIMRLDERVREAEFTVEPKLDGLTVVLHYQDGTFVQGATRGNGEVGEDITENLRTIKSLPLHIPIKTKGPKVPESLVVRGEVIITKADFIQLNERLEKEGKKTYLNPRNTAAGSLRQLDSKITAQRPLTLLVYAIVNHQDGEVPDTQWETLSYLKALGFPVAESSQHCKTLDDAIAMCNNSDPDTFPFEVDGMVIKVDKLNLSQDLGVVGKDPRGAIAYKFPAMSVTTKLMDIGVKVGRTGVITPYAVLQPVEIGGVVVRHATLHNFDFINDKDIRIGDRVLIKRAGEVIPYVIDPIKDIRSGDEVRYSPPANCPSCGDPLVNPKDEVAYFCTNSACPAQLIRNLEHFVSREAMDIVGLGVNTVHQLVEAGLVKDIADLYRLEKPDLLKLEGFGEKKADNLITAIEQSRASPLHRLVTGLGIRLVGQVAAQALSTHYPDLHTLSMASKEEIEAMEGFGPNMAESIIAWFNNKDNQLILDKLKDSDVWPVEKPQEDVGDAGNLPLAGLTFVITGTLPTLSRTEAKELIESKGGKVTGSVSGNTDYLLLGENPGSKFAQAQKRDIPTLSEDALRQLINEKSA